MWLDETSDNERKTLAAAFAGYAVDAFDYMVYTFVIPTLMREWGMSQWEAGVIATASLITSAIGGWAAGVLADRHGRVRVLQWTVAWFSLFTFLAGFAQSFEQLLFIRALQGFGFGGEWSVGAVLVAETVQARHRGKAAGLVQSSWAVGWGAAAIAFWAAYALLPAGQAWRVLFWLGIAPALLIVYIRRHLREPAVFRAARAQVKENGGGHFLQIFSPKLLPTTVFASLLCMGMMGAYYAVTTWLPSFLEAERKLSVPRTSGYLLVLILGSFLGYLASAYLSDRLGRKPCFMLFAAGAGLLVYGYTHLPIDDQWMLFLGFPLGFFLSGIFSGMGAFLAELFPSALRGSGQGFCYNFGRASGALFPALAGYLGTAMPLGEAIGLLAAASYLLVIAACIPLPETRGRSLAA